MLGRIQYCEPPMAVNEAPRVNAHLDHAAKLKEELKQALDMVFELNEKLSKFSWNTREIVNSWLKSQ